ncbi:MAG: HAMP domain-containing histidine kinase [Deltaproteobacteria bacterium]|nr:HAMP domain-containing histidine kinase [Deltaproteobacteria bacterium]
MVLLGFKKQSQQDPYFIGKLDTFRQLVRSYSIKADHFLESFDHIGRLFDVEAASLYVYEKKTNMFLLRKWFGFKPSRLSISGDYEFINFLKTKKDTTYHKDYFEKSVNEIRQPALLYFQHTISNVVSALIDRGEWYGIINCCVDPKKVDQLFLLDSILEIYADLVKKWMQYQQVIQVNKKLAEVSHVKDQLLSNVTHELQTPLNGILGIAEALLDDPGLSEEYRNSIKLIRQSGADLSRTLGSMLELVQIEAHKNKNVKTKFGIFQLIKETALLYGDQCKEKSIDLVIPALDEEIFVYAQIDQIRTVLMNLTGNAIKFTNTGSITIEVFKSGEKLHVKITDTGIGIDEDKLTLIFEEFYQTDGSHTRMYGGTGLGLAIVKKIIALHGGRIWVESKKGVGTCVQFTLPLIPV